MLKQEEDSPSEIPKKQLLPKRSLAYFGNILFNNFCFLTSFAGCTAVLANVRPRSIGLKFHVMQDLSLETKTKSLSLLGGWIGIMLLALVTLKAVISFFLFRFNPVRQPNHKIIRTFDRIMTNTLEQAFLFFVNLAYWLVYFADQRSKEKAVLLAVIWFSGRLLYAVGYLLGVAVRFESLRMLGMATTLYPTLLLLVRNLGLFQFI